MIAVILASARLERLYTGLSLLVSAAAEDRPAHGLVTFPALAPLLDPQLTAPALRPDETPTSRSPAARPSRARSPRCSTPPASCPPASCGRAPRSVRPRAPPRRGAGQPGFDGVLSTPRFLHTVAGAQLVAL